MGVKIVIDKLPEMLAALKTLRQKQVLIGIPADSPDNQRKREPGETQEPPTNAALGYWHEYGLPEKNIPARPFLISGVEKVQGKIADIMKRAGDAILDGRLREAERGLGAVGELAVSAVRQKIVDGPFVPLAPRTLAERAARGVTRTDPLIDTGALRQAITYVVVDKNKKD